MPSGVKCLGGTPPASPAMSLTMTSSGSGAAGRAHDHARRTAFRAQVGRAPPAGWCPPRRPPLPRACSTGYPGEGRCAAGNTGIRRWQSAAVYDRVSTRSGTVQIDDEEGWQVVVRGDDWAQAHHDVKLIGRRAAAVGQGPAGRGGGGDGPVARDDSMSSSARTLRRGEVAVRIGTDRGPWVAADARARKNYASTTPDHPRLRQKKIVIAWASRLGEQLLLRDWWPALVDGLTRAEADLVPADDVAMAFYGDLFRPQGELRA
jgi:hypothetical protein